MKEKAAPKKEKHETFLRIVGTRIETYSLSVMIVLSIVLLLLTGSMITWGVSPDVVSNGHEVAYYVTHGLVMAATIANIIILIINKKRQVPFHVIAIIYHLYAALLIIFATVIFICDLTIGLSAIFYLLILTFVAGLFTVEPISFFIVCMCSLASVVVAVLLNPTVYFFYDDGAWIWENIIGLAFFVLLLSATSFKNFRINRLEYVYQQKLIELSYRDELTGLLNERSYLNEIDSVNQRIQAGEKDFFAVMVMDVNNLKATNDQYGHRYGCSLVVRCGKTLPTIFKTSKLFHVGGDEFLAIIYDEDLANLDAVLKDFDEKMLYSTFTYEGVELVFSVARGFTRYNGEPNFRSTMQIADDAMYENKKYLKEKYNMKGR